MVKRKRQKPIAKFMGNKHTYTLYWGAVSSQARVLGETEVVLKRGNKIIGYGATVNKIGNFYEIRYTNMNGKSGFVSPVAKIWPP